MERGRGAPAPPQPSLPGGRARRQICNSFCFNNRAEEACAVWEGVVQSLVAPRVSKAFGESFFRIWAWLVHELTKIVIFLN